MDPLDADRAVDYVEELREQRDLLLTACEIVLTHIAQDAPMPTTTKPEALAIVRVAIARARGTK